MSRRRTGRVEPHGNRWRFQVFVEGQRIRRSFDTRAEAEQALEELLEEVEGHHQNRLARELGPLTVGEVVSLYYERRKPQLELSTQARYENVIEKHIVPGIGSLAAGEVAEAPMLLEDFLAAVPWGSARKALEVLGPAFRMASENGLIPSDPAARIRRPRRPSPRRKKEIPTPTEVEKMVISAYETDFWWGLFVELTATLGTRRGETCALRFEDFEVPGPGNSVGWVHVRRAVGKKAGGSYLKAPKSGEERSLMVDASLFDGLDAFAELTGWLFPGRPIRPRRRMDEITVDSTAGRLILHLADRGGEVTSPSGRAGAEVRRAIGTNSATMSQVCRSLEASGHIQRDVNARRTFRVALTPKGHGAARGLRAGPPASDLPMHPDTAAHRFQKLVDALGLRTPSGKRYTLHSLRHFRATHQYNRSKDWVQVARFMGHTSPSITMDLYANNVVEDTQRVLAEAAVRLT